MSADIDCLKNTCECANHDGLLYRRIGERLEKELATAKAENGRLVEAKKKIMNRVYQYTAMAMAAEGGCKAAELIEDESIEYDALSSSNALNYWRGEILRARSTAFSEALAEIYWRKTQTEIIQAIEKKMLDAMRLDQNKGEKERKPCP